MKNIYRLCAILLGGGFLSVSDAGAFSFYGNNRQPASEELKMGNTARARGDISGAAAFYRKAMQSAAGDQPLYTSAAVSLGKCMLEQGKLPEAKHVYAALKKQYPTADADVFSALILAAEGRNDDAVALLEKVIASQSADREEALFHLGQLFLQQGKFQLAMENFNKLSRSSNPVNRENGKNGLIYSAIRSGNTIAAKRVLDTLPEGKIKQRLDLLLKIQSKDYKDFKTAFSALPRENQDPGANPLLYEICSRGADLAAENKDSVFAEFCLKNAYQYAANDTVRRDLMLRLLNAQSQHNINSALQTLERYLKVFPDAHNRAVLQLECGRLLTEHKKYDNAIKLFESVIKDEENLLDERISAADDAAKTAEKAGMPEKAREMYQYLITHSIAPGQRQRYEYRLGTFLLRQKKHLEAENCFRKVAASGGELAEESLYWLLETQMQAKRYSEAKLSAQKLLKAENPNHVNFGRYTLALLTELSGDVAKARSLYLDCLSKAPSSSYAPQAAFSAAKLAEKLEKLPDAIKEYLNFAEKYPDNANTPAALFFAMRANCMSKRTSSAVDCFEKLESRFPAAQETKIARLQLADYLLAINRAQEALKLLPMTDTPAAAASPELEADTLLLRGRVQEAAQNHAGALQTLKKLLEKYPASAAAANANILAGNILYDLGELRMALGHFEQAEKLHPADIFGEVASGRIADCNMNLYSSRNFDQKYLKEALQRYEKLASESAVPQIRLQSIYKAALCYELAGSDRKAISTYERTLYLATVFRSNGVMPDPVWCSRAAYRGARLISKEKTPDNLVRALRMIRLYESLNIENSGEDFNSLRRELKESYNSK